MSADRNSIVHDTSASEAAEEIDITLEASLDDLGAEGESDSGAGPPLERIVLIPEAAGDDEVGITFEWRLEGVSVNSLIELMTEFDDSLGDDAAFDRLAFNFLRGGEDEIGVSLHGRIEDTDDTLDSENSPLQRIIIESESE